MNKTPNLLSYFWINDALALLQQNCCSFNIIWSRHFRNSLHRFVITWLTEIAIYVPKKARILQNHYNGTLAVYHFIPFYTYNLLIQFSGMLTIVDIKHDFISKILFRRDITLSRYHGMCGLRWLKKRIKSAFRYQYLKAIWHLSKAMLWYMQQWCHDITIILISSFMNGLKTKQIIVINIWWITVNRTNLLRIA